MCFTDIFWSVSENLWFSTSLKSLEHGTYHRSAEFRIKNSTAVNQSCSVKIWLNLQENTCTRVSFLMKFQGWYLQLYEKRDWHRCFSVSFVKLLRTPFCIEHLWWLLLILFWHFIIKFVFFLFLFLFLMIYQTCAIGNGYKKLSAEMYVKSNSR